MRLMECAECGCVYFIPAKYMVERKENGGNWHCPNGHSRVFCESEVSKLQREKVQLREELCEELAEAKKKLRKAKRELTKLGKTDKTKSL